MSCAGIVVLRCLLVLAGLGLGTRAVAQPAGVAPHRRVLVWIDAKLYAEPDVRGPAVVVGALRRPREESLGSVIPMTVVGTRDDFLEVEPVDGVDCVWAIAALPDELTAPRLYVLASDLAPVLTTTFRLTHADGSGFVLEPGVPVGRSGTVRVVSLNGNEVPAPIPDAAIGVSYAPHAIASIRAGRRGDRVLASGEVRVEEEVVPLGEAWTAPRVERRHGRVVFPLRARCMTVSVVVPAERVMPFDLLGFQSAQMGGYGASGNGLFLPAGIAMTSGRGDHVVARTRKQIELRDDPVGGVACITRSIALRQRSFGVPQLESAAASARALELCAPSKVVIDRSYHERVIRSVP